VVAVSDAEPPAKTHYQQGIESGFDDAWHEVWWRQMEETGGNIIAAMRMRMVSATPEAVVMSMPFGPGVRQGTGIFAAGALIQLADVAATSVCFESMHARNPEVEQHPFPLAVQISSSLIRNVDKGTVFAEARLVHSGRTMMVVESKVTDEAGRLLCSVNSTHLVLNR
jgi:1,4-dihydroxy-2-naphthoyl-CoA hydrolase